MIVLQAASFAPRCAVLCEKYTGILQDFTGELGEPKCLDVGCSIGATTMELSKRQQQHFFHTAMPT